MVVRRTSIVERVLDWAREVSVRYVGEMKR